MILWKPGAIYYTDGSTVCYPGFEDQVFYTTLSVQELEGQSCLSQHQQVSLLLATLILKEEEGGGEVLAAVSVVGHGAVHVVSQ